MSAEVPLCRICENTNIQEAHGKKDTNSKNNKQKTWKLKSNFLNGRKKTGQNRVLENERSEQLKHKRLLPLEIIDGAHTPVPSASKSTFLSNPKPTIRLGHRPIH